MISGHGVTPERTANSRVAGQGGQFGVAKGPHWTWGMAPMRHVQQGIIRGCMPKVPSRSPRVASPAMGAVCLPLSGTAARRSRHWMARNGALLNGASAETRAASEGGAAAETLATPGQGGPATEPTARRGLVIARTNFHV